MYVKHYYLHTYVASSGPRPWGVLYPPVSLANFTVKEHEGETGTSPLPGASPPTGFYSVPLQNLIISVTQLSHMIIKLHAAQCLK